MLTQQHEEVRRLYVIPQTMVYELDDEILAGPLRPSHPNGGLDLELDVEKDPDAEE